MQIKVRKRNGKLFMRLKGTLDGSTACQIEQVLQPFVEGRETRLVVDFSGVGKVEYFGVVIFAKVLRSQCNQFGEIIFTGLLPSVENIFKRFGFLGSQLRPTASSEKAIISEISSWQTS